MNLSPMRFKDYVWPHNPRVYEISFRRIVDSAKIPFGAYALHSVGRTHRVLRGEGEFTGPGAYDQFRALADVFYDDTPGVLIHPVWQASRAYLVELSLRQEPCEDYVSYAFEFWECFGDVEAKDTLTRAASVMSAGARSVSEPVYHTVARGDDLWSIARSCGVTVAELAKMNPQLRNPNLLKGGDRLRVGGGSA